MILTVTIPLSALLYCIAVQGPPTDRRPNFHHSSATSPLEQRFVLYSVRERDRTVSVAYEPLTQQYRYCTGRLNSYNSKTGRRVTEWKNGAFYSISIKSKSRYRFCTFNTVLRSSPSGVFPSFLDMYMTNMKLLMWNDFHSRRLDDIFGNK